MRERHSSIGRLIMFMLRIGARYSVDPPLLTRFGDDNATEEMRWSQFQSDVPSKQSCDIGGVDSLPLRLAHRSSRPVVLSSQIGTSLITKRHLLRSNRWAYAPCTNHGYCRSGNLGGGEHAHVP
jgi:hypothetical protein